MFKKSFYKDQIELYYHSFDEIDYGKVLDYSSNNVPKWFREIKKQYFNEEEFGKEIPVRNVKGCPGFIHLFNKGFILKSWFDIVIKIYPDKSVKWLCSQTNEDTKIQIFPDDVRGSLYPNHVNIKIDSPIHIKSIKDCECLYTNALSFNNIPSDFFIINGIINFKYVSSLNLHLFFPIKSEPYQTMIKTGTPLVQIINLQDKKMKLVPYYDKFNIDPKHFFKTMSNCSFSNIYFNFFKYFK